MDTAFSRRAFSTVVREDVPRYPAYEPDGSERRALGSVRVPRDARWRATLTVPVPADEVLFVHIEREGELPPDYRGSQESADFSIPLHEADALVTLLAGVVAQARHDGVIG